MSRHVPTLSRHKKAFNRLFLRCFLFVPTVPTFFRKCGGWRPCPDGTNRVLCLFLEDSIYIAHMLTVLYMRARAALTDSSSPPAKICRDMSGQSGQTRKVFQLQMVIDVPSVPTMSGQCRDMSGQNRHRLRPVTVLSADGRENKKNRPSRRPCFEADPEPLSCQFSANSPRPAGRTGDHATPPSRARGPRRPAGRSWCPRPSPTCRAELVPEALADLPGGPKSARLVTLW